MPFRRSVDSAYPIIPRPDAGMLHSLHRKKLGLGRGRGAEGGGCEMTGERLRGMSLLGFLMSLGEVTRGEKSSDVWLSARVSPSFCLFSISSQNDLARKDSGCQHERKKTQRIAAYFQFYLFIDVNAYI